MSSNTSQQPQSQSSQTSRTSQAQGTAQQPAGSQSQSHSQSQTGQGNNTNTNASVSIGAARPATVAARTAQTLTRRPSHPRIQALVDDAGRAADPSAMRTARPKNQVSR